MLAFTRPRAAESKFRLLYLGTHLELIATLRKALKEFDYWIVSCSERESAGLFIKSEIPYHLLLIDFEWQEDEGLKLARLARSLRHRKRMPIILVATELSTQLKTLAGRAGVNECVTKTADRGAIIEAIRKILNGE